MHIAELNKSVADMTKISLIGCMIGTIEELEHFSIFVVLSLNHLGCISADFDNANE